MTARKPAELSFESWIEIRRLNATSLSGPATTQAPLDVEALVADWRRRRAEAEAR